MSKDLDTPAVIRRQMLEKLPQHLKEKSEALIVKKMMREVIAHRLENASDAMMKARQELENIDIDVSSAEVELRDAISKHVKENNQ